MIEEILSELDLRGVRWLVESIAARYRVTIAELLGGDRRPRTARARHELFGSLWGSGWSYSEIGRTLRVNHTTVMAGVRRDLA